MLLADRKVLVTGVLSEASIATSVARLAQEQGADVLLTSFGRALGLTQRVARRLPRPADVVEIPAALAARRRASDQPGLRGAVVRLVPRHHGRDRPRGRRLPRRGGVRRVVACSG